MHFSKRPQIVGYEASDWVEVRPVVGVPVEADMVVDVMGTKMSKPAVHKLVVGIPTLPQPLAMYTGQLVSTLQSQ